MTRALRRLGGWLARHRSVLVVYVVSGVVGVSLWLTGVTLATSAGDYRTAGAVNRTGTATVGRCDRSGPISLDGFGYRWKCQADVRWDDGRGERVVVLHGQLSPADTGRQVSVAERRSRGRGYSTDVVVPPFVTDSGRANTGHVLSVAGIVLGVPFGVMTAGTVLFLAVVVVVVALAAVAWLVQLVVAPRTAMAGARRAFRRS